MVSGAEPVVSRLELAPVPESARAARSLVTRTLSDAGRADLVDSATLLVSELVTNAIVHARTSISVEVEASGSGLHVGVNDRNTAMPARRDYGSQATTGRGLEMVDLIAARHGTELNDDGSKTVWFELGQPAIPESEQPASTGAERPAVQQPTGESVEVVWRQMPLRLARAWQQHADALLREQLLLAWEDAPADASPLAEHARGAEAFAALAVALDAAPPAASGSSRVDLRAQVSREVAAGFADLDRLVSAGVALAERDELLVPPTQPEIRLLRVWVCRQAARCLSGDPPEPWPGLAPEDVSRLVTGPDPAPAPPGFDAQAVRTARDAVIAADDGNRIIGASPAALALLGWTEEDLVGRRVVTVVPPRFREDHIAAFTDHLLSGRESIIGRPVRLPALRRGGDEVEVDLLVRREAAAGRRPVFLATLLPVPGNVTPEDGTP